MSHKSEQYLTNPRPRPLYQSWGSNTLTLHFQWFSCPLASHPVTLREHDFLQVGEVSKDIVHVALATTDSWGFPLSPTSVQNVLTATPNLSPDQFQSIISGLANTI